MEKILEVNPVKISEKQAMLQNARLILKKEFAGIDEVIDQVVDSLTTWFLFPELQERPLIINLWGMTGVGKTALVLRLSELLEYEKKSFRFDLGNNSNRYDSLKNIMKSLFSEHTGQPYILIFDEFQYARTKNEEGFESENHFSRILWELMDSGKFQSYRNGHNEMREISNLKTMLSLCIREGVVAERGIVTENEELFTEIISSNTDDDFDFEDPLGNFIKKTGETVEYSFVPRNMIGSLYKYFNNPSLSIIDFKKLIADLDGPGTIKLIERIIENGTSNKRIDCSKTVIFNLGNLDEAYKMSSSFNPDIDADDFHEASKYINIGDIKKALKKRFKNEQIARLGNNHIIYPAFSRKTFEAIILMSLQKIADTYYEKFHIHFTFSTQFLELLYQEGVYPTQGTRPLFSTIYQLVNTRIPALISENILLELNADTIQFDFLEPNMLCTFLKDSSGLYQMVTPLQLSLAKLRFTEKDDVQAITAVHESGHAVISMAVSKVLPDYICSTSADTDAAGFVVIPNKWKYFAKEDGIKKIAEYFGGILAEALIFGKDKVTCGAQEDIARATELATKMVKDFGMGKTIAFIDGHGFDARHSYLDKQQTGNNEVQSLLDEGKKLAEKILVQERMLLLQLADFLSDERIIKKDKIEAMARMYGSDSLKTMRFIEDGKRLFYRNELKSQVMGKDCIAASNSLFEGGSISLNRLK